MVNLQPGVTLYDAIFTYCAGLIPPVVPVALLDFTLTDFGPGARITAWNQQTLGPQPSDAVLSAITAAQASAAQTAALRGSALIDFEGKVRYSVVMRALALVLIEHFNVVAAQHNALLSWLGGQTTLANRAALNGFTLAAHTPAQVLQAVQDEINSGSAD